MMYSAMGTDVTGVGEELNKSPCAKIRAKVSVNPNQEVDSKQPEENKEVKDFEVKECTSEAPRVENSLEKSSSPGKLSSGEVLAENMKLENAEQTTSDVTVDKQVCGSPRPVETPVFPTESSSKSPNSPKKSLLSTPHVTKKHLDDEDNWSMTSSASVRTTRSKVTVPVAPTFSISDRLEKRKEYYAKLEEKRKALEAEKREYEARTKEEEDAALKQMRKNMKVKANPVPSFYYEKPPPKRELKKLPTTRAVSPKFGRRKSCSDALRPFSEEKTSVRAPRHSLGGGHLYKEGSTPTSTPTRKERSKQGRETNQNIAVQS